MNIHKAHDLMTRKTLKFIRYKINLLDEMGRDWEVEKTWEIT